MERRNSKQVSGGRGVLHTGVCGRLRIWSGTCREPNDRTRVGAYCIRPSNVPAREQKTLWPNLFGIDLDNRFLPETSKGRMQYAPTARYLTGFAFVLPKIWVKPAGFHSDLWQSLKPAGFHAMSCGKAQNPPGFALCRVAKSKTRRVSRHVVWQSPKPAGFRAMSCGKVQNPPGFALCRVAESKTRRVSRYVVWQNPKPAGFYAMLCGRIQNPPGFTLCRVAESKTRRVLRYVVWQNPKPAGFWGLAMIFFSSLDGRKEAKEDQGLTEAGEVGRVHVEVEK